MALVQAVCITDLREVAAVIDTLVNTLLAPPDQEYILKLPTLVYERVGPWRIGTGLDQKYSADVVVV